jgi:RHS repeat-associated protein
MRPRHLLLVLTFALFCISPAFGQDAAGTEQGLKPYGAFHGGDIDSISMVNMKLNLHIPLVSYPQRGGKLHLGFYLSYYNQIFSPNTDCIPPPHFQCFTTYQNTYTNYLTPGFGGQNTSLQVTPDFPLGQGGGGSGGCAGMSEGDGTNHLFGFISTNPPVCRSMDATGFMSNNTGAFDKFGTQYTNVQGTGFRFQDTNGNFMTATVGSGGNSNGYNALVWTDTMGRSVPNAIGFGSGGPLPAVNVSSCPGGPLPVAGAYAWNLPGVNGGTMTYTFCVATYSLNPNIWCGDPTNCPAGARPRTVIQSIVIPNNTAWKFEYDGTNGNGGEGDLTKIIFPTGGSISYTWTNYAICTPSNPHATAGVPVVASRTVDANDGTGPHTWTYGQTYSETNGIITSLLTTVTGPAPQNNVTTHTQTALGGLCTFNETEVARYNGAVSQANLIEKVDTVYGYSHNPSLPANDPFATVMNVVPTVITTTLGNGQTKKVVKTYDTGVPLTVPPGSGTNIIYGNLLSEQEYDYGNGSPGALIRTTNTNYQAISNSSYLAANLLALPSSVQITDGSGVQRAYTTFGYDESPSPSGVHGNQTSAHHWLNTTGTYLTSTSVFNTNGTIASTTDPKLNTTSYGYSSGYAGSGPTSVTNPKSQTTSFTYDFNTGQKASVTDPNSQKTSYTYDVMWRLASATYPDGGGETITHQESTFPFSATSTKKIAANQSRVATNFFDGLGRLSETQLTDLEGKDFTVTTYDADGRVASVTNPYRSTSDPSYGVTTTAYDALNRPTQVTKQDGSVVKTAYCGSTTLVTDEVGHWRRSKTDGLGRPIEVDEPNSTSASVNVCPGTGEPIWVTTYGYDTLDDLVSVTQSGSHGRSFAYDSLKRLTSSTNPETGTTPVTYTYDADGNVLTKADARAITITYSYDNLNRLTDRTYSNNDPPVTYTYDQATCVGQSPCYNIGRRTSMTDAAGSEVLSYDTMGREWGEQRTTNGVSKTTTYTYNFEGDLATLTYPSGRTMTYTTANTGWPAKAVDVSDNVNYVLAHGCNWGLGTDGVCHTPWGAVSGEFFGDASSTAFIGSTHQFNNRLQPSTIGYYVPGANGIGKYIKSLSYSYTAANGGNNGNVMIITNTLDATRSQTFTYDQVNRITNATTPATCTPNCWSLAFTYDQWANLQSATATGSATPLPPLAINANNRITAAGFTYDASGNLTADVTSTYAWNAESEIKTAAGVNYTYDGDGNRVMKSNGKIYWYGAGTEILEETDATGSMTNASFSEYIYFAGKRVARHDASGNVFYYMQDALGTTDGMVEITANNATETFCYDADFYPYGGEKVYTNTCPQNYKFEGKERDTETGNDDFGARYYSSVYGRWLSPDWSSIPVPVPYANLNNPQTLNLYAMVSDNPETFADLDGHDCQDDGHGGTCESKKTPDPSPYIGNAAGYYAALVAGTVSGQSSSSNSQSGQNSGSATDQTTGQSAPNQSQNKCGFLCRLFGRGVRFEGSKDDKKKLKDAWKELMKSEHARGLLTKALKNGKVTVRSTSGDPYFDPGDRSINVGTESHPLVMTTAGLQPAPTAIILGHELGHAAGYRDVGPNRMNNVNASENPIREDLGLPDRTEY